MAGVYEPERASTANLALTHQGGGRADQRADAAEDRQVTERQEQPRGRQLPLPAPIDHHRRQHRHDGRVEHKSGDGHHRQRQAHQAGPPCSVLALPNSVLPTQSRPPVSRSPAEAANKAAIRITAPLANPEMAWVGDSTPVSVTMVNAPMNSRSTGTLRRSCMTRNTVAVVNSAIQPSNVRRGNRGDQGQYRHTTGHDRRGEEFGVCGANHYTRAGKTDGYPAGRTRASGAGSGATSTRGGGAGPVSVRRAGSGGDD